MIYIKHTLLSFMFRYSYVRAKNTRDNEEALRCISEEVPYMIISCFS